MAGPGARVRLGPGTSGGGKCIVQLLVVYYVPEQLEQRVDPSLRQREAPPTQGIGIDKTDSPSSHRFGGASRG
jgi:hypothetical protein